MTNEKIFIKFISKQFTSTAKYSIMPTEKQTEVFFESFNCERISLKNWSWFLKVDRDGFWSLNFRRQSSLIRHFVFLSNNLTFVLIRVHIVTVQISTSLVILRRPFFSRPELFAQILHPNIIGRSPSNKPLQMGHTLVDQIRSFSYIQEPMVL